MVSSEQPERISAPCIFKEDTFISWVKAGGWCESPDNYAPCYAEEWLDCPFPFSQHAFCLAVTGDSMWPEYREGEYILVDPGIDALHGNDVVDRPPPRQ